MSVCDIQPISAFQSTNLNSKIESFDRLGDRILRQLGYPLVTVELHKDQLNEIISIAVEMFTKYAGYTKEYLIFDSNLYELNKGIKLDALFSIYGSVQDQANNKVLTPQSSFLAKPSVNYISISSIPSSTFASSTALSSTQDIVPYQIFTADGYNNIISFNGGLSSSFIQSKQSNITIQGTLTPILTSGYETMFDYDVIDYRKVIAITDFEEGSTTGINTLFTLEQTLAQQTYFSYALGNYGFDLISWYTLKEWIKDREKLLAIKRTWKFDEYTQYLQIYPQPKVGSRFWGVLPCYVERPIRDVIKHQWVQNYALALSKITVARVRGKFTSVQLLGGGVLNYGELLSEGLAEKDKLEQMLFSGAATGYGDGDPVPFLIG